ncbi:MAG: D-2-hydroxyacid dehydrogenase [Anaerolineae bacterium]|nr:D-2-hydroxyacid dehydrogenase [Anaerolineae bacterium]
MVEPVNVLVTLPFEDVLMEKLRAVVPGGSIRQKVIRSVEDLRDAVRDIDVLYTVDYLPEPEAAPRLKWVQVHTAGVGRLVEHPLYTTTEITFTNASGVHAINIAEYVMSQILAFAHRLPRMLEDQAAVNWPEHRWNRYVCDELYGATLGILGYGAIGRQLARVASGFGMTVLAVKRDLRTLEDDTFCVPGTGDPEGVIPMRFYPPEALHSFLSECDYVASCAPLTTQTHHVIDAKALSRMRSNSVLINISRGAVIDEAALADALARGVIAGAALDVFEEEPLPSSSPLWKLNNVIISPHVAGFSPRYEERATDLFAENLRRFVSGEPLRNMVIRGLDY